jgi:hypothetical protein
MHSFTLSVVDESMLQLQLHATGFGQFTWLDAGRRWASASFQNAG